jgi:predicted MFS family arabinose efflux permease
VDNNWVRLVILLSVLLLLAFPFAGLAPLTLLLVVGICGWIFRLIETIVNAKAADKNDSVASE